MPGQINVDTTNETVTLEFRDDHGNVTDAPSGATVTFTSDNETVATVTTDSSNPLKGDIKPLALGTANINASITGANDPSGNPFTVTGSQVTVGPGPAASADLVLSDATPTPAPSPAAPAPAPGGSPSAPGTPEAPAPAPGTPSTPATPDPSAPAPTDPNAPAPTAPAPTDPNAPAPTAPADPNAPTPVPPAAPSSPTTTEPAPAPPEVAPAAAERSVYTYEGDPSNVDGTLWPKAPIQTSDGKPLFYYANDQQAGDHNGDGIGNVWRVYTGPTQPASA